MTDREKIQKYLKENYGSNFHQLGIQDESKGRWVQKDRITNRFLVRHLKIHVVDSMTTSEIGKYLYHDCNQLLNTSKHWTTRKGHISFWYAWQ